MPPRARHRRPSKAPVRRDKGPPHDGSYKHLFSHAEMVEGLLRDFVHEPWLQALDFSTLERCNGSYVTDDLREREDDVIWRVRLADRWLYIYLLIEFQSTVDPWMALRVMVYTGLLYQDLVRTEVVKAGERLPPVFPLVLYNGNGRWTAKQELAELIEPLSGVLARYRPSQRYFLVDEGAIGAEELARAQSVAAELVRLETLAKDGPEALRPVLRRLVERLGEPRYSSLRRALTVWFRRVLLRRLLPQEPLPELHDLQEVETMLAEHVQEWTEKWMREGERKGWREGKREGEREGMREGKADTLKRQVRRRFGELPDWAEGRIDRATVAQLDAWLDGILEADSLDDLLE